MSASARLYFCCRCQAQVIICSRCDRGHRYCTGKCAAIARSDSLKRARQKYQSTRVGRFNNAARQQRYRARKKQKVTHQGSPPLVSHDVLKSRFNGRKQAKTATVQSPDSVTVRCHHCGAVCEPFLRQNFLHQSRLSGTFRHSATARERL